MKILTSKPVGASSMRDVRKLLLPNAAAKALDYNWRSPQEMAFYANSVADTIQVRATTSVDLPKLTLAYSDLIELQSRLDSISGLAVLASERFKHSTDLKQVLSSAASTLSDRRDTALAVLQRTAKKNEPKQMQALASAVSTRLTALLGRPVSKEYVYATVGDSGVEFSHFLKLVSVVTACNDFTYGEYYVVLSSKPTKQGVDMFITALTEFRAPGSFHVGQPLCASNADRCLQELLADYSLTAPSVQLPVSQFKTPVLSVCINSRSIDAVMPGTRAQALTASRSLAVELNSLVNSHTKGLKLRCILSKEGAAWNARYTLSRGRTQTAPTTITLLPEQQRAIDSLIKG